MFEVSKHYPYGLSKDAARGKRHRSDQREVNKYSPTGDLFLLNSTKTYADQCYTHHYPEMEVVVTNLRFASVRWLP